MTTIEPDAVTVWAGTDTNTYVGVDCVCGRTEIAELLAHGRAEFVCEGCGRRYRAEVRVTAEEPQREGE